MKKLLFLLLPSLLFGQTNIYRSIQYNNTSALATGAGNNLTISGTTATFANALPDSIGVGDAIQYDDDNDGDIDADDSICFISGRTSSTVFTVANAAGGTPTATAAADQDWSIFRAYINLSNAEAGTENTGIDADVSAFDAGNRDIVSNNEVWHFAIYRTVGGSNETLTINGWTTGASNYMRWFAPYLSTEVGTRQRHLGIFNTNYTALTVSGSIITVGGGTGNQGFVRFEGLQLKVSGNNVSGHGINFATSGADFTAGYDCRVSNCLFQGANAQGTATGDHAGVRAQNSATSKAGTILVNNCLFLNWKVSGTPTFEGGVSITNRGGTVKSYNNTAINCAYGFSRHTNNGILNNVNCIAQSCEDGYAGLPSGGMSTSDCISDIASDSDIEATLTFNNVAGLDYHLALSDTATANQGTDLSADATYPFSVDVDNETRTVPWHIGMDQFIVSESEPPTFVQRLRRRILWWQ